MILGLTGSFKQYSWAPYKAPQHTLFHALLCKGALQTAPRTCCVSHFLNSTDMEILICFVMITTVRRGRMKLMGNLVIHNTL